MKHRDLEARLMANSAVCEETGCWVWLGAVDKDGYGYICIRVKVKRGREVVSQPRGHRAHRVAYEELKGVKLAEDDTLDHRCLNRRCINPGHMTVVTRAWNTRLAWARRRFHDLHQTRAPF